MLHIRPFAMAALFLVPNSLIHAQERSVSELAAAVASEDQAACVEAIDELTRLGPDAQEAVPALVEALSREDALVRGRAARALAAIGPNASSAVVKLSECLSDQESQVRAYAAFALGRMGKAAEPALERLVETAFDSDVVVRRESIRAVRRIEPPIEKVVPLLTRILEESEPAVILPALQTVARDGKEALPRLREFLKHDKLCYWAAVVVADIGPDAAEAVPELTELLGHEGPEVRLQALVALGEIGAASKPAIPAILAALDGDEFGGVRYAAAYAIGRIGEKDDNIQKSLYKAARDDDPILEVLALWALARLNPEKERGVRYAAERMAAALKSDNPDLRRAAARALAEFDAPEDVVAPVLVDALEDADPQVVGNALDAIASLGPKILDKVGNALKDEQRRHHAVRVIYRMGQDAAPAVPALVEALGEEAEDEDDVQFRCEVQFALSALGPAAVAAVPQLIESLSSDDKEVRGTACFALGKIGPDAKQAVPAIQQRLSELDEADKVAFGWALLKILPGDQDTAATVAPLLISALNHEMPLVRAEAATALGQLGDLAKSALPRLQELLNDPSAEVRDAAGQTLKRLAQ
jgi:HEAT repeat protein